MKKHLRKLLEGGITLAVTAAFLACYYATKNINQAVTDGVAASASLSDTKILLDAGHGGFDGGCVGVNDELEKDINLKITKSLFCLFELSGYEVSADRLADEDLSDSGLSGIYEKKQSDMKNRLEFFNSENNAVCISVHQNQYTDGAYSGAQMFYSSKNPDSERLAQLIQESVVSSLQPENEREIKLDDEMYLLGTESPSVMVECGFLSNEDEAAKLTDSGYQKEMALSVFSGVYRFLN